MLGWIFFDGLIRSAHRLHYTQPAAEHLPPLSVWQDAVAEEDDECEQEEKNRCGKFHCGSVFLLELH